MASQTGDAKTLLDGEPATLADVTDLYARLRVLSDERTFDSELLFATSETFTMPQVPKGAKVRAIIFSTASGAGDCHIGTSSNATLFGSNVNWNQVGLVPLNGAEAPDQEDIVLTAQTADTTGFNGNTVRFELLYTVD